MQYTPTLKKASLMKRYKRFLADIVIADQTITTIHVANTGAMTGCAQPDDIVWYSTSTNPKRKYPFSWEFTQTKKHHYICVNTLRANQLVEEAINNNVIKELSGYKKLQREVKYGNENSKIDFFLSASTQADAYVEVKSVTLLENQQGYFPDAVTARGQKHLRELIAIAQSGQRAVLLFAVLHTGIKDVKIAQHIDPHYHALIIQAKAVGVEIIAYKAEIILHETLSQITLTQAINTVI